jgi:hypothetical protein
MSEERRLALIAQLAKARETRSTMVQKVGGPAIDFIEQVIREFAEWPPAAERCKAMQIKSLIRYRKFDY